MDLAKLKRNMKENFLEHKQKKRNYYLKKKLESSLSKKTEPSQIRAPIDYEKELEDGGFFEKLKEIAKKQKLHIDDRKEIIIAKLQEYKIQKQQYYQENKEKRLEYDKEYREMKKEQLREYRREYYAKNKENILARQKQSRMTKKIDIENEES